MAVAPAARRADCDEDGGRTRHRGLQIGREGQAPARNVVLHQRVELRLIDRNPARLKQRNLARILVDADHFESEFRETRSGDKPDISAADDGDFHERLPIAG